MSPLITRWGTQAKGRGLASGDDPSELGEEPVGIHRRRAVGDVPVRADEVGARAGSAVRGCELSVAVLEAGNIGEVVFEAGAEHRVAGEAGALARRGGGRRN